MKTFLKILGGILLLGGIIWGITLVVAVATHMEGFENFTDFIPGLAIHAVLMFLGMVCIGLGQRVNKPAVQ